MKLNDIYAWFINLNRRGIEWMRNHLLQITCVLGFLTASVIVLWPLIYLKIPSGYLGVIYKPFFGGVDLDTTLDEGIHFIWPWDKVFQYSIQVQTNTIEIDVLTSDLLKSKVTVVFEYSTDYQTLPYLHKYVGENYLEKLIIPQITSVTREMVGKFSSSNAFTDSIQNVKKNIAINSDEVLIDNYKPGGLLNFRLIRISDVQITKVSFPKVYETAVEEKLVEQAKAEAGTYRIEAAKKEASRKAIEAEGIRKFQDIVAGGLTDNYLRFLGITATESLAQSNNAKVVVFGNSPSGLPLILGGLEQADKGKQAKGQPSPTREKSDKAQD